MPDRAPENRSRSFGFLPGSTAASDPAPEGSRPALPLGNGETILVVDDEQTIRDLTRRTLEVFGYRAWSAADGREAVVMYGARMNAIDLVLTDMMMPVMDGPEAIRAIAAIHPQAKIIATSGLGANAELAFTCGAVVKDFLQKPYSVETLLQVVRKVLGDPALFPAG